MIMPEAYRAIEHLRDGRPIEIRAVRPDDKDDMLAAIGRTSTESLRRRFFVVKRGFSQKEIDFFVRIDFRDHIALIALADEDGRPTIVGGGRYVVVEPGDPGCVKTPMANFRVELPSRFRRCKSRFVLATTFGRRQLGKRFCASFAQASFHTAWVKTGNTRSEQMTSALPPKADSSRTSGDVR